MARDVHPEIKRALGASDVHASKADRLLDQAEGKPRKKQPSLQDITEDITEEISSVIREELAKKKSDHSALSLSGPLGWHMSARGRVVWLLAVILALAVGGVLLGRATAPHRSPAAESR